MILLKGKNNDISTFKIRVACTCTYKVLAVALKLVTFQYFDKIQNFFGGFFNIISSIAETLCAEREREMIVG